MLAYRGQDLGRRPHVAVLLWGKLGNFIVGTVVLRALRERFPDAVVDLFGGERNRELEEASSLVDARYSLVDNPRGLADLDAFAGTRIARHGQYDLGINLDFEELFATALGRLSPRYVVGRAVDADGTPLVAPLGDRIDRLVADREWNRLGLVDDYPDLIGSQYLGELWCRWASLETEFTRTEVPTSDPGRAVPAVLIATGGTRRAKQWPGDRWAALGRLLRAEGLAVGLVGIARELQARHYGSTALDDRLVDQGVEDLRGAWSLPQVGGAAAQARCVVTIDNAIGHIAAAVGAPTVMLWGGSPWRLWAPRGPTVRTILPTEVCALCELHRFKNDDCLRERQVCLESITPRRVMHAVRAILR
jgi:ADP-heptose:LPS heptosyltransferase